MATIRTVRDNPAPPQPTQVIEPDGRSGFNSWSALWQRRELLRFLIERSIRTRYAQSILGPGWALVQPVVSMIVLSVFFGRFGQLWDEAIPYPIFAYTALVPWTYFAGTLAATANSLITYRSILQRIAFPRLIVVIEPACSKLLDFVLALGVLVLLMFWYQVTPSLLVVPLVPILVLLMVVTTLGIGLWLAPLAAHYRDISHMVTVALPVLLYATPVIFSLRTLPAELHRWYAVYPTVGVIEGFRAVFLNHDPVPWDLIGISSASALLLLGTGLWFFISTEQYVDDII